MDRPPPANDPSASELDDEADRDELRSRYYGLLQELRVLLPGAQVLVAFMLTAPFATHFGDLDGAGRTLYGIALVTGALSIVAFAAPTAFHRFGARTDRSTRLQVGILMIRAGLILLGASLTAAVFAVARFVFDSAWATLALVLVTTAVVATWFAVPLVMREDDRRAGRPAE